MTRRQPRRARRGFTLLEVMVSLGIMTIGAMAVIALQTQTIRANAHARQLTTATQVAQIWLERLKQDACMWTDRASMTPSPPESQTPAVALGATRYLGVIVGQRGAWVSPPDIAPPVSRGFDFQGNDTRSGPQDTPFYCAAYRLNWVYFGDTMRADVRVWWPRAGSEASPLDFAGCTTADFGSLDPGGAEVDNYHGVYLSTVFRVSPLTR